MKKIQVKQITKNTFYVHNPCMHTAIVSMWFRAGSVFDGNTPGIAHLFEHILLQKTQQYKEGRYAYLESKGIEAYAHTYKEFSCVYHVSTPQTIVQSLSLLKEGVFDVFFDNHTLEHEKKVVLREIEERTENEKMWDSVYANVYKNNPREHCSLGTQSSIKNITFNDLKSFFHLRYISGPCTYVIFAPHQLTGVKKNHIQSMIHVPENGSYDVYTDAVIQRYSETIIKNGTNIRFATSYRLPRVMTKRQKSIVYFIASTLAGNWNSLLTQKLRSEYPYTYWTYISPLVTYKEKSFHIYFDIAKKDYGKVRSIVKDVLDNFSRYIYNKEVFKSYKHVCITNIHRESEDIKNIVFDIGSALCVGEEPLLPHEIIRHISQITPGEVARFWKTITENY